MINETSIETLSELTQNQLLPTILILTVVPWFILFICGMCMTTSRGRFIKILILPTIILIILLLFTIYPIIPKLTINWVENFLH